MFAYVVRRIVWSIPVILLLAFTIFALMRAIPGGPFDFVGDRSLPQSVRNNLERRHHLDWPLGWQFSSYVLGDDITGAICQGLSFVPGCERVQETAGSGISRGLIRGDLGMALRLRGRTVNDLVKESFPVSFQLGIIAMTLALIIGIPAGIFAALKQNTWIDFSSSFVAVIGLSIPNLVLGPLLIWIFPLTLGRLYPNLFGWIPIATWGAKPPFFLGLFPTFAGGGVLGACSLAGNCARHRLFSSHCPVDPCQSVADYPRGLYSDRSGERITGTYCGAYPCPEE